MKTTIKKFSLLGLIGLCLSCNNDLDEIVYSDVTQNTYDYKNAYQAMGIVYANMRGMFNHTNYFMMQETTSDELVMPANGSGWDDGGIFKRMHTHSWNSENPQLANLWNGLYRGVINSNRVIEQLESGIIPIPVGIPKVQLIAEMKTTRAFYYWLICDNYGDAPLVTTTSTELPTKTARKEIYNFIVSELSSSIPLLSEDNNKLMYGRFNRWGAKALLANVYLNAGVYTGQSKWNECLKETDDIINSGKYNLEADYRKVFATQNENSREIIFAIPFDEVVGSGFYPEMFSWHGALKDKVLLQASPWGSGSAMGVPQFIDTYDQEDKRLADTWLMGPQFAADGVTALKGSYDQSGKALVFTKDLPDGLFTGESQGYRMNKYEVRTGSRYDLGNDFPFFRYAQILMMKAECQLRLGNSTEAARLVSQVRSRSFTNASKAVVSGSELIADTKYLYGVVENYVKTSAGDTQPVIFGRLHDELGWEFAWEGHRRRDNIRFGVFTKKSWLSHKPNGENRSVFLIPQSAVNSNPKLSN